MNKTWYNRRLIARLACAAMVILPSLLGPSSTSAAVAALAGNEIKKLIADNGAAEDNFGVVVDISGNTLVVGAVHHASETGAAYVFERDQGGIDNWGQVLQLNPTGIQEGDQFGSSVAISGDIIAVGAASDDGNMGTVYLFHRNEDGPGQWGQIKMLTADVRGAGDFFGISVAISGGDLVVGSYGDDSGQGSAYVFNQDQGGDDNWGLVKKIAAGDGAAGDNFGISVAISGEHIVAGAFADESIQGSAYVFRSDQGGANNWGQVKKLTASDGAASDNFGRAVAAGADIVVAGAFGDDSCKGAAYVFRQNEPTDDNWGQVKKLTAGDGAGGDCGEDTTKGDSFGLAVAVSSDGNIAAVGAFGDDLAFDDQGSVYVFRRDEGGANMWGQFVKLTASDGQATDKFGIAAAFEGDLLLVGAYSDSGPNDNQGSAYLLDWTVPINYYFLPVVFKN